MTALLSPITSCAFPQPQQVQIEISNEGTETQSNFPVGYSVNGGSTVTEVFPGTLPPGETATFIFSQTVDMSDEGAYEFLLFTDLPGDQNPANDELTAEVENLPPLEVEVFNYFGTSDSICGGEFLYLYATPLGNYQYEWSTGDVGYLILDQPDITTTYSVTVTDLTNPTCQGVGSLTIEVLELPEVPVAFASSNTLCPGGTVTIEVLNVTENLIWNTGETGPSITVSQPGNYFVTHVGDNGCTSRSDNVWVGIESTPFMYCFGDCVLCGPEEQILQVSFGENFQWSNGDSTQTITVMPSVNTTYSVTVTTPNGCQYTLEETVIVASDAAPGTPTNLLPPDGSQNIALPLQLNWAPTANATHYDIYVWEESQTEPPGGSFTPYSTTQINYTIFGGLQYGETYKWKVCARNTCSAAAPVCSAAQKFTLNFQPDLVVVEDSINSADTLFSGTEFEVSWQVENVGIGSTQGINTYGYWYDAAWLSTDDEISFDDLFLGSALNPAALLAGAGYTNSLTANLPEAIAEGEYFLIVCTDRYGYMPESDEANNCTVEAMPVTVERSPYPDLVVTTVSIDSAAGGIVAPGEMYGVNWTVKNQNSGGFDSGPTKSGWWYDRIYFSQNDTLDFATAVLHKTIWHEGDLEVGEEYHATTTITIPATAEDTLYIYVCTDATDREFEFNFENNNHGGLAPLTIPGQGKPDFALTSMSAPDTASNRELVTVNWTGVNEGQNYGGSLLDRIYINTQPDLTGAQILGSASQNFALDTLENSDPFFFQDQIQIPSHITGKHYLMVRTNAGNVDESDFDNNLLVDSIVVLSPNLTVADIAMPPDATTGQTVTFHWTVANPGDGDLLGTFVGDRVRLVDVDDPANSFNLFKSGSLTIFSGGTAGRQKSYTVPNGLSGSFCVEVTTNYSQGAYENGQYADNSLTNCDTFHITEAAYPNLVASSIEPTVTAAVAGGAIETVFNVENGGPDGASGFWADRVYLSTTDTWPLGSPVLLGSIPHSQVLPAANFYEKTLTANLSTFLAEGTYYLCLSADHGNSLFENNENDNRICSTQPIEVTVEIDPTIDLRFVGDPLGPDEIAPGETASVFYEVENNGNVPADGPRYDALYLSPDPVWAPTDILLTEWLRTGPLDPGESSSFLEDFTLPPDFDNAFFLCLVIDHENAIAETNENNNYEKILQSNGGGTVVVTYPPKPDLTVDTFNALGNGTAGQPLTVDYVIKNVDDDGEALGVWTDGFYLSSDTILDLGDQLLGQKVRPMPLLFDEFYEEEMQLTLPLGLSGNVFLLLKTDAGNGVNEEDETNNVAAAYISVTQPAPGDLFVVKDEILAPPVDTIATDITIEWETWNIGQNPLSGFMQEGVYLSEDEFWDASDHLLGVWSGTVGLDPGASVVHSLTARLENVKRQEYHVFVKTDLLDHFLESDEANNCSNGPAPVFVEVPELPIGLPTTPAILELEQPIYYRIEIPADTVGETMRVSVSSADAAAFNELYLRRNDIPSRTVHDFAFNEPFVPNQDIVVPSLQPGTYYVMVYSVEGSPVQSVELLAEIIPFQITSIEADKGGNTGSMTALLEGAKFHPGMEVWLSDPTLGDIVATQVEVVNGSRAFVTFPLDDQPTGIYDVLAQDSALALDTLPDGFEVVTGTVGNGPLLVNCSMDLGSEILTVTNVPASVEVLEFEPVHPSVVRPNQVVPITLVLRNMGDVDIPTPSRMFSSLEGFPLGGLASELVDNTQELPLTFIENNGPTDVLRPGGVATITVYSKATQSEGVMKFKLLSN